MRQFIVEVEDDHADEWVPGAEGRVEVFKAPDGEVCYAFWFFTVLGEIIAPADLTEAEA